MNDNDVVIVSAARTPIGKFQGIVSSGHRAGTGRGRHWRCAGALSILAPWTKC
ncbi:MAG: hypothetical protein R2873_20085 [Caldilineaceae bacterium]